MPFKCMFKDSELRKKIIFTGIIFTRSCARHESVYKIMKLYEWGDNTGWISCVIYKNKKKVLEHIRNITQNNTAYGDKAYIYEINTIKETREKIITLDLK